MSANAPQSTTPCTHTRNKPRDRCRRFSSRSAVGPALLTLLLAISTVGCAAPRRPAFLSESTGIVWPPPPDAARVRYLGELTSSADVGSRGGFKQGWNALLYGESEPDRLVTPHAVAVDASGMRIAVADTNAGCVHLFDLQRRAYTRLDDYDADAMVGAPGAEETAAQVTPRGLKPAARVSDAEPQTPQTPLPPRCPVGVAWAGATLAIADARQARIYLVEVAGGAGGAGGGRDGGERGGGERDGSAHDHGALRSFGTNLLQRPSGVAFNPTSDCWYVVDAAAHAVFVFERDGRLAFQFGQRGAATGEFNYPAQIAVAADGSIAVTDALNFRVQRFAADGALIGAFGRKGDAAGDFALPKGVAFDAAGNLWISDAHFENVQAFTPDGRLLLSLGREGSAPGDFWLPAGLCIDRQDRLWVADTYNRRVQVFQLVGGRESGSEGVRE